MVVIRRLAGTTSNSASTVPTMTSSSGTPPTRVSKIVRWRFSPGGPDAGRVPLRIEVDQQHPVAHFREPAGVGHRKAGFAGATLEVQEELAAQRLPARVAVQHSAVRRQVSRLVRVGSAAQRFQLGQFVGGG